MSIRLHFVLALFVRLLLIVYGAYHDLHFKVKYTDVDYEVFTDAARYVANGESPFNRSTYRYTPLLAFLMLPNVLVSQFAGKLLFVLVDVLTGFLIFRYFKDESKHLKGTAVWCASLWWYNPLCLTISTRGNAESLMACSSVATLLLLKRREVVSSAIVYGLSVHFKLYTIIYALPIYLSLSSRNLLQPTKRSLVFAAVSALSFFIPTVLSYYLYGPNYLQEAIVYHASRKDTRHNFSPYFYLLYLTDEWSSSWILGLMFLPQLSVLILLSLSFGNERDLVLCLFSQTFFLVMFNKVCTSQYFVWFLCLLPLLVPSLVFTWRQWIALAFKWFLGQSVWLLSAYLLEFQGFNTFIYIWLSGLFFLFINVHILQQFLFSYKAKSN